MTSNRENPLVPHIREKGVCEYGLCVADGSVTAQCVVPINMLCVGSAVTAREPSALWINSANYL